MLIGFKMQGRLLSFLGIIFVCVLVGCSSSSPNSSSSTSTGSSGSPTANAVAPAVVTVSDAPLSNILSAKVTVSSITLGTGTAGGSVSLLSKPVTIELSSLGAVQEPIELTNVTFGTYNSATVTVTSAQVTYLDSTNTVVTATATLNQPTLTVALTPALAINSQNEVQLRLAFNLAQSFSIAGTTVTFTPAINTAGVQVSSESNADREIEMSGQAIAVSASSITVQSGNSGRQFSFAINSSTQFPTGVTINAIQAGEIVQIRGQVQTDGSLLALAVTPESDGNVSGQGDSGARGIIVSVTKDTAGTVTAFSMISRENFGNASSNGATQNVTVLNSTTFGVSEDALQMGLTASAFTNEEIFAGQSVVVTGTSDSSGSLNAKRITLAAESLNGTLAAAPLGTAPNFTFTLTLPASSYLTTYDHLKSLDGATNQQTEYDNGLNASSFASLSTATNIEIHGYLLQDNSGHFSLYAKGISQVETPETSVGGDN